MATAVKEPRLKRSAHVVAYWVGEQLVIHNFATGIAAEGEPLASAILHFFGNWKSTSDLLKACPEYGEATLRRVVSQLERATMLERRHGRAKRIDHDTWASWNPAAGFFHFSTKDDFAALDDIAGAEAMLARRQAGARAPRAIKIVETRRRVVLPSCERTGEFVDVLAARRTWRSFSRQPLALADLSALAHLTFGIHAWGVSDTGRRIALKTSPSGGAIHPIEAYVVALNVRGLAAGLYHYRPDVHALERMETPRVSRRTVRMIVPGQWWFEEAAALFLFTAVFARKQWRYRFPRAYRSVLLEAGHFAQTFCLTATSLGLAPFCTQALADRRIERWLGIDGVSESVIYATGVGRRPEGATTPSWPEHAPGDPWSRPI